MKNAFKLVPAPPAAPAPYDEARGRKRIATLRQHLITAAARYVLEGKTGKTQDRVREASDLSGIPRNLIEVEIEKDRRA